MTALTQNLADVEATQFAELMKLGGAVEAKEFKASLAVRYERNYEEEAFTDVFNPNLYSKPDKAYVLTLQVIVPFWDKRSVESLQPLVDETIAGEAERKRLVQEKQRAELIAQRDELEAQLAEVEANLLAEDLTA